MLYTTATLLPLIVKSKCVFTIDTANAYQLIDFCTEATNAGDRHATYKVFDDTFLKLPKPLNTKNCLVSFKAAYGRKGWVVYIYLTETHRIASHEFQLSHGYARVGGTDALNALEHIPRNTVYFAPPSQTGDYVHCIVLAIQKKA